MWWGPKAPQLALCRHTGQNLHNKWARYRTPGGKRSRHGPQSNWLPLRCLFLLLKALPHQLQPITTRQTHNVAQLCRTLRWLAPDHGQPDLDPRPGRKTDGAGLVKAQEVDSTTGERTRVCMRAASIWLSSKDLKSDRRGRRRGEHLPCTIPLRESRGQTLR